jgi:hypothetical protein
MSLYYHIECYILIDKETFNEKLCRSLIHCIRNLYSEVIILCNDEIDFGAENVRVEKWYPEKISYLINHLMNFINLSKYKEFENEIDHPKLKELGW